MVVYEIIVYLFLFGYKNIGFLCGDKEYKLIIECLEGY